MEEGQEPKKKFVKRCVNIDKFEGRYLHLEAKREVLTARRLQNTYWYATNASNQKYVKYYNLRYRTFESTDPSKIPSHPRERHRCDYHITDFVSSLFTSGAPGYGCFIQLLKCFESEPG